LEQVVLEQQLNFFVILRVIVANMSKEVEVVVVLRRAKKVRGAFLMKQEQNE